jgi:hypothetical protein
MDRLDRAIDQMDQLQRRDSAIAGSILPYLVFVVIVGGFAFFFAVDKRSAQRFQHRDLISAQRFHFLNTQLQEIRKLQQCLNSLATNQTGFVTGLANVISANPAMSAILAMGCWAGGLVNPWAGPPRA